MYLKRALTVSPLSAFLSLRLISSTSIYHAGKRAWRKAHFHNHVPPPCYHPPTTYITSGCEKTPSHLPHGHTSAVPIHFQPRASIFAWRLTLRLYRPSLCLAAPRPLTITDNKMNIGNEKSSGFPFSRAWVTVSAPFIFVLTLALCAQARHAFIGIKIKVVAGGQWATPPTSPPLLIHTSAHTLTMTTSVCHFPSSPHSLSFCPQLHLLGLKGF